MGSGRTSGMVTDDSETFRLDNLESEVVGGPCSNRLSTCDVRTISVVM